MGSFDRFHTGALCGQVKCWGKGFNDYEPGMHVVLHAQLTSDDYENPEKGLSEEELSALSIRGRPRPEVTSFQVACGDDQVLVVKDSIWLGVADAPVEGLEVFNNRGHPFTGDWPAFIGPSGDCEVCNEVDDKGW